MPATQRSSQSTASGKKQQTISSFFTKSSSPVVKSSPNGALPHESSDRVKLQERSKAASADQPDDDLPVSPISTTRAEKHELASGDKSPAEADDSAVVLPSRKRLKRANFTGVQEDGGSSPSSAKGSHCSGGQDDEGLSFSSKDTNKLAKSTVTERTSRFLFSSSHGRDDETVGDTDKARQQKDRLHQDFVKKLGEPDSIARIKRRTWQIEEEIGDAELAGEGDQDEEEPSESTAKKAKRGVKKGGSKLTPLEKQVLEIKRKNLDTLLVIEVGYKFRFFGEDARIAAKELSIVCIPGKLRYDEHPSETHLERFASASIPVHRLHVHVKRLVAAGHKVGVVRQLETAALKAAGDNRNAPFVRSLTNVYTKGTYIDDVEDIGEAVNENTVAAPATGYLLCITETRSKGWGTDENVHVGILAVQPLTGDVIYDSFDDGFMRSEIETRLLHMAPCELLIVGELTKASEKLVQHLSGSKTNVFGDKVRLERVDKPKTMAAQASSHVTNFYAEMLKAFDQDKDTKACALLEKVLSLPDSVTICLSAMITHLTEYCLEHVFKLTKYFQSFSARSHMLLNGTALASLEIYQNQTDHSEKGSLFWTLDRTKTRFGHRLLRKWVGRPLLDKAKLEARVTAVQELQEGEQITRVEKVRHVVWNIKSDLEKSLIRIYYGKVCWSFTSISHLI
jgi:DNA mismatch repair protein MSH3